MARAWLVTGRGIATKIKNGSSSHQIRQDADVEANMKCPNCNHLIDNSDVALDWPGFPAGVKFEPSDAELIVHLEARIGLHDDSKPPPHILIDEFIPMLEDGAGICYTHPQNLPGAKKDGSSVHFFHRVSNAYAKGRRKRRRISHEEQVRWHKTGKTKRVFHAYMNGVQIKGWKKIMVLYTNAKGAAARPASKAKWVVHQYHIGPEEDELEGQLVVSKVFYQQSAATHGEESEMLGMRADPRTPNTSTPQPPRLSKEDSHKEDINGSDSLQFLLNQVCNFQDESPPLSLQCHEHSFPINSHFNSRFNNDEAISTAQEISDLDHNILMDTPLDFQFTDLQFGSSQESTMSWLDKLLD
ncbi:SUPPRESSOR OF GAMMA RESPONSE 1-like isoform X1 [Zingiber officinale]|uniref:NAC domain-containing protein n=2 Tax=Zingiber officinale TaxID=94328 RepID=A0A8J5H4B0_ZINOF|nr:SUPPRESSOR OF GAMMA RESPONSE 1-like isoform X1 [Zingiber officinale]KAG6516193.1 hypothetical protein ZIOFF_026642 [Zingiber officinale]